jgi:hypothetical protein
MINIDKKCITSRKKTLTRENKSPRPSTNKKCSNSTINKNGINFITPKFMMINTGNKKTNPMIKFKKLANTQAMGTHSGNSMPCLKIGDLAEKELVTSSNALVENIHGIIPASTKRV